MEARDQADAGDQCEQLGEPAAEGRAEAVEERFAGAAELEAPGRDRGVEPDGEARGNEQRQQAGDDAARDVARRLPGFLGGERKLFYGEEQPHGEGQRCERAVQAEGQQRSATLWQFDRRAAGAGADVERMAAEIGDRQR